MTESTLPNTCGRILLGDYSPQLKERLAERIAGFRAFDTSNVPAIPYISAWHEDEQVIWYEFAGRRLLSMLGCDCSGLAEAFRESIVDYRVFRQSEIENDVQERVISGSELTSARTDLRRQFMESGTVEAVYQIALPDDSIRWLKDNAVIETFRRDRLCLSLGVLTDISKEMEHKELLEQIGYIDGLTNLPNRNIMTRSIEVRIGQVERRQMQDFVFLLLDLDHFKQVNDTHGHQAGDHVLATVAEVMCASKRREEEIGRYGGEEFYGLIHGDLTTGRLFAERLRQAVESAIISYQSAIIPVTISIGLAAASEITPLSIERLIRQADRRLYDAKRSGRNRVVWQD